MRFEKVASVPASEVSNGHKDICVLVVDCDPTCLATISRMLTDLTYQVKTVDRAEDALEMTLEEEDQVDLVMTELHMPDMDGIELLDKIQRTSRLPVVIMSDDDDEDAMLRSLNKGAMYYMIKPVEKGSLKNLWQYVFLNRKEKQKNGKKNPRAESLGENEPTGQEPGSGQIINRKHGYQEPASDSVGTGKDDDEEEDTLTSPLRKKPKLVWTTELHNKFLFAIAELGLDNAHPKKILRIMGVEGLTKEQVSSHLQKYRQSAKRDRLAVHSVLEYATRKPSIDYFGSSPMPFENRSLYNFPHGNIQAPTMASQPGFAAYMQGNHGSPINIKYGQYCCYPSIGRLHGLNNGGRPSHGWGLFNNAIMLPPQPWQLLPPPPPPPPPPPAPRPQGRGTDDWTFTGEPETDPWFYMRNGGNQLFPKRGF